MTDDLDRTITDSLRTHVDDVTAGDRLLERIRTSVADSDSSDAGKPPPQVWPPRWLVAAAAAALVAILVWNAAGGTDSRDTGVVTDDIPDTVDPPKPEPEPEPEVTTTTAPDDSSELAVAPLPDRAVVAFTSTDSLTAELALVDLSDGSRIATIDTVDNSDCGDVAACHQSYANTAVSSTYDLFVETCCEPAGGNVPRRSGLDPETGDVGDAEQFLAGFEPAIHPQGREVAAAGLVSIEIRNLVDSDTRSIALLGDGDSTGSVLPTGLAWSPDGSRLAVSLDHDQGGSTVVVVPADAESVDDGQVVSRSPGPRSLQAWTVDNRLWLLHDDDAGRAYPVTAVDARTGTSTTFDVAVRELAADRTGRYMYAVTDEGLRRADPTATTDDMLLGPLLVPAGDATVGAVSVFSSNDCAATGDPTVAVPDVTGLTFPEAADALAAVGLRAAAGDTDSSRGNDSATVTAQEPPPGSSAPVGTCVGLRTSQ